MHMHYDDYIFKSYVILIIVQHTLQDMISFFWDEWMTAHHTHILYTCPAKLSSSFPWLSIILLPKCLYRHNNVATTAIA